MNDVRVILWLTTIYSAAGDININGLHVGTPLFEVTVVPMPQADDRVAFDRLGCHLQLVAAEISFTR